MKMGSSGSMAGSKRRLSSSSSKGLGGVLREQRARLYIIRSSKEVMWSSQSFASFSNGFVMFPILLIKRPIMT
ncbi:hypothetical protein ACFX2C_020724 [Malus domestica]